MNQFLTARIRLTLWYTFIILIISFVLSGLYYLRTVQILNLQYRQLEGRFGLGNMQGQLGGPSAHLEILQDQFTSARMQIQHQILIINGIILLLGAAGSWFLSGRTLSPIQMTMEEQKRFVSDAAHELRTPIAALRTSLEVNLMDKKVARKTRSILEENLEDVISLETLTQSLLKLARVDDQVLDADPVSITAVVDQAVKQIKPLAEKKKQTLELINSRSDTRVIGDQGALLDLILILMDNAVKYTPEKGHITLSVIPTKNHVKVRVQDDGIGIAKHHLPYIFNRFYRVDSARTKSLNGSYGLGLSLAQKIVDEHSGKIEASSKLDLGTTFTVILPRIS